MQVDGEGVTTWSGPSVNDDTMSNLDPSSGPVSMFLWDDYRRRKVERTGDCQAFISGLAWALV